MRIGAAGDATGVAVGANPRRGSGEGARLDVRARAALASNGVRGSRSRSSSRCGVPAARRTRRVVLRRRLGVHRRSPTALVRWSVRRVPPRTAQRALDDGPGARPRAALQAVRTALTTCLTSCPSIACHLGICVALRACCAAVGRRTVAGDGRGDAVLVPGQRGGEPRLGVPVRLRAAPCCSASSSCCWPTTSERRRPAMRARSPSGASP